MRILLTNDDGINAPGLAALTEVAQALAGPGGEVWTVAPAFEQSGVGHTISYTRPMLISQLAERRFAVEGSPADCVLAALYDVLPERPELVLSGINRGNNAAENALYSGTLGAAMEAALQDLPAVALSQYLSPDLFKTPDIFDAARRLAPAILRRLMEHLQTPSHDDYRVFFNVNFPPCPAAEVKGTKICAQGRREETYFSATRQKSPTGRDYLWLKGGTQHGPSTPGADADLLTQGYVSVTPMRADLTAQDQLVALSRSFETGGKAP
ncbi:MAG: 5'/3'-nucleotidase SurE [Rhodobacterales bacterium]|nr:MAG: 5'/3'-nucleotidase SurE [Rhodobacterales bacterium]